MAGPDGHPLLRLDRLSKRFGDRLAVEALTLDVAPGEIYGLIGPNGSGKTTTVKMIVGLYRPTAGQVLIAGIDLGAEPERAKGGRSGWLRFPRCWASSGSSWRC